MRPAVTLRARRASEAIREYAQRRMAFALDRFGGSVSRVGVELADVNGPRGGADKVCRMAADLAPAGRVVVASTNTGFPAAIDQAARGLRLRVSEELRRRRNLARGT